MELLLFTRPENYQKVRELLLKDEITSKASIAFRGAKVAEGEGYYCYLSGSEEQCERALQLMRLAEEVKGEEKEEIIKKIKEEQERATEGFGRIFEV